MTRISQKTPTTHTFILKKKNDTKDDMLICTTDFVSEQTGVRLVNNNILLGRLKPGKSIALFPRIVSGTGQDNATFCPTSLVFHHEADEFRKLRQ